MTGLRTRAGTSTAMALALAGAVARCSSQPAVHHRVGVQEMTFQPDDVVVAVGDTVTWTNRDIVPHTVTGVDGAWGSGQLGAGGAYTLVPDHPDTLRYECAYHPTMRGVLIVR